MPDATLSAQILSRKLAMFDTTAVDWSRVLPEAEGLSHAELVRASEEAAKRAVLGGSTIITPDALLSALKERKAASH